MFERLKTAALILLVAISLYLSYLIWHVLPPVTGPGDQAAQGGTFWGPGIDALELVKPARIIVHRGSEEPSLLYPGSGVFNQAWQPVLGAMQQLGGLWASEAGLEPADDDTWRRALEQPALEVIFDLPIELQVWGQLLDYEQPIASGWSVGRLCLTEAEGGTLLLASPDGEFFASSHLPAHEPLLENLLASLSDRHLISCEHITGEPAGVFGLYVPTDDLILPAVSYLPQPVDPDAVAGSFFADLSLTRRIDERDGATIYSDGRRGLRVWPSSYIEYSAPEVLDGVPLPLGQAFQRSVRFVTQHGGWLETMRLAQMREVKADGSVHYQLSFRDYQQGLPVLEPLVSLELSDRGVAAYEREMVKAVTGREQKTLSVGLLIDGLAERAADQEIVTDVYAGYGPTRSTGANPQLVPVWVMVDADGQHIILDEQAVGGGAP